MNKRNSLILNATLWSFAAEFAAKILVPITNIILARLLVPADFGIIATINMIISFAETMTTAGFQKYLVQRNFDSKETLYKSANVAFWTNFLVALFFWGFITVFRYQVSSFVGNSGYETALVIAILSLPIMSLTSVQEALFQRSLNYKVLFNIRIVVSILPFFVTIPLALCGYGYWSLIIGTLSGMVARVILLMYYSEWRPTLFYNVVLLREMWGYGSWILAESLALWASSYIDILIISNRMGAYYTGLYKSSQTIVTGILSIITGATTSVLFASLSREQDNPDEYKSIFYGFQNKVAMFVLPVGVGIFCYSDFITSILLGQQWMEASHFIGIWGLCTSLVCVFGTFSREVYRSKGCPRISFIAQMLHLVFVVPVCMYGVSKGFGVLAYLRSFAYLQIIVVHMIFVRIFFGLSPVEMLRGVKEPILGSVLMGGTAFIMRFTFAKTAVLQLFSIFICMLVYGSILILFKPYRNLAFNVLYHLKNRVESRLHAYWKD